MIDPKVGSKIVGNLTLFDVQRLFLRFKTVYARHLFNDILQGTKHEEVFAKMNARLELDKLRTTDEDTNRILWKYYLKYNRPKGFIYLDDGAIRQARRKINLFLVGVIGVKGLFEPGDVVNVCDRHGKIRYYTVTELSSQFINAYKGLHSYEICDRTGNDMQSCIVSRGKLRLKYTDKL